MNNYINYKKISTFVLLVATHHSIELKKYCNKENLKKYFNRSLNK